MKGLYLTLGIIMAIFIVIFGFENMFTFSNVPIYILIWPFYIPIGLGLFLASLMGVACGWVFALAWSLLRKEAEEDSEFYE